MKSRGQRSLLNLDAATNADLLLLEMSRLWKIGIITLACGGIYAGMRSLPVEPCEFLHYGEFVNAEGAIEGCGYEETAFFNMDKLRYPIVAELTPLNDPEVGKPVLCQLELRLSSGKPIRWENIAISHTERIHAMVVDSSLEDYQHIHPQPAGAPGIYTFEMTPRRPGTYKVYLDLIPLTNNRRTLLSCELPVAGEDQPPEMENSYEYREDGFAFQFNTSADSLVTGKEHTFELDVKNLEGDQIMFSPVMGSYAHVVAFDTHRNGFAHLHPVNPFIEGQDPTNPDLEFTFLFDDPGNYRVWAQIILNGKEWFIPFDLEVQAS